MGEAQLGLGSLSLRPPRLLLTPLTLPPPHVVRLGGGFGRVCSVGEVVEVIPGHKADITRLRPARLHGSPVGRGGAVHVVVPVADAELLVEAGLVCAHVGDPAAVLVTHVEYLHRRRSAVAGPGPLGTARHSPCSRAPRRRRSRWAGPCSRS